MLYEACLEGFKLLYEEVGFFDVTEEMIFFTKEGHVRVWMNPNLSKHQPNYEPAPGSININYTLEIQGSQAEMIATLIHLIEANADSHDPQPRFKEHLQDKGILDRLSFYKAIEEFHKYCEEQQMVVGSTMTSIQELFNDEEELGSESQSDMIEESNVMHLAGSSHPSNHQTLGHSQYRGGFNRSLGESRTSHNSQLGSRHDPIHQVPFQHSFALEHSQHPPPPPIHQTALPPRPNNPFSRPPLPPDASRKGLIEGPTSHTITPPVAPEHLTKYRSLEKNPFSHFPPSVQASRPVVFRYNDNQSPMRPLINQQPSQLVMPTPQPSPLPPRHIFNHSPAVISSAHKMPPSIPESASKTPPPSPLPRPIAAVQETSVRKHLEVPREGGAEEQKRKESIIEQLHSPVLLQTEQKITSRGQISPTRTTTTYHSNINYYSPEEAFTLDSEIAEDMVKYLGLNPNLL